MAGSTPEDFAAFNVSASAPWKRGDVWRKADVNCLVLLSISKTSSLNSPALERPRTPNPEPVWPGALQITRGRVQRFGWGLSCSFNNTLFCRRGLMTSCAGLTEALRAFLDNELFWSQHHRRPTSKDAQPVCGRFVRQADADWFTLPHFPAIIFELKYYNFLMIKDRDTRE